MADYTKYTKQEMQAYAIAKNIKENQIVIVGTGLPLIGASLAKRVVCPSCHPIVESGLMDCSPVEVPRSVGDNHRHLLQHHHHDAAPEAPLYGEDRLHHLLRLDGRPRRP